LIIRGVGNHGWAVSPENGVGDHWVEAGGSDGAESMLPRAQA